MMKNITILGSTGSIGRQTLEVCRDLGVHPVALTARKSVDLLEAQVREFSPELVVLEDMEAAMEMTRRIQGSGTRVAYGLEGLMEAASLREAECVITAVVGMVGLRPTLAAIQAGKRIGLANKETLVCAGELVMDAARRYGAEIVPVDSEHSAIFQCLRGCRDREEVRRLILTCSGGPFFGQSREETYHKTRADALKHPNWTMGAKITVDCASLMNKGLEVMEAMHLFHMPPEQVSVAIHRQSVIHSMVEYRDGAILAQMGTPDMRLPIRLALTYPARAESPAEPLDLLTCPPLTFHEPDLAAFPALGLALKCAREGGTSGAILNGANEEAVGLFLGEKIPFGQIPELVERALDAVPTTYSPSLEDVLEADRRAREIVRACV